MIFDKENGEVFASPFLYEITADIFRRYLYYFFFLKKTTTELTTDTAIRINAGADTIASQPKERRLAIVFIPPENFGSFIISLKPGLVNTYVGSNFTLPTKAIQYFWLLLFPRHNRA